MDVCKMGEAVQPPPHLPLGWLDWTEQCFTSPPTQYRLYGRPETVFTGQKTQPTVSKYWRYI